mgnify:CR=1 FL=1
MDWDLRAYFEDFRTPLYRAFKEELTAAVNGLNDEARKLLERPYLSEWEGFLADYEAVAKRYSHLSSYISCLTAADARNEAYLKEETVLSEMQALFSKVMDKIIRGLGLLPEEAFAELLGRDSLKEAEFRLREWRRESQNRMSAELEDLAADLGVNGISAWSRLYFTTMGNLKFTYTDPQSGLTEVPMAQLNSLLASPERARRIAASEGAANTFAEHQYFYAGALNAISGTRHVLNNRRGREDFLEPSLEQSRIQPDTLKALMTAIEDQLPFAREVFRFRSERLGIEDPGWVDLRAPLPFEGTSGPSWEDGVRLISGAFKAVYPDLGAFFDELVEKQWIDHTPRSGKRPGGFCTGSLMTRESRIFMTYKDTLNDVLTLAHETGHAWHSRILANTRVLASQYPMTLAETASTLAERMLTEGVMMDSSVEDTAKLIILDAEIEHMLAFLLDLPIRFRFEEEVYTRRRTGTLSPNDLCQLMRETQRTIFGEVMTEGREDPWFWASKMHFYINQVQFYNYPYTFGYLLSTAYMEHFRENGSAGLKTYERFLTQSGQSSCEEVVQDTLGADIQDPAFWSRMIDGLERPFGQYRELLEKVGV